MPNWGEVLRQIEERGAVGRRLVATRFDAIRREYLNQLHQATDRNVIAYYSGWLSKPSAPALSITDEDKNGFMMAIHQLDRTKGLDLILHTPGGGLTATQSIINYLWKMFDGNIRAIVPQIAMSAGTIIACCCREIIMTEHSDLGPIDPQIYNPAIGASMPAKGVIDAFNEIYDVIKGEPDKIVVYRPILERYTPTLLVEANNVIGLTEVFVQERLMNGMLRDEPDPANQARSIVASLLDYSSNKLHDKRFHLEDCRGLGLKVTRLEDDPKLQDLVLTIHHCYMHTLTNTPAYKLIENHSGAAMIKTINPQR